MLRVPSHNNVVALVGMCPSPLALLVIILNKIQIRSYSSSSSPVRQVEYAAQGALDAILYDATAPRRFDVREQRSIALDVARGVAHLHAHKIVHRDLAARNIVRLNFATPSVGVLWGFFRVACVE